MRSFLGWGKTVKKVEGTASETDSGSEDGDGGLTFKTIMLANDGMPDSSKTALCIEVIGARQVDPYGLIVSLLQNKSVYI